MLVRDLKLSYHLRGGCLEQRLRGGKTCEAGGGVVSVDQPSVGILYRDAIRYAGEYRAEPLFCQPTLQKLRSSQGMNPGVMQRDRGQLRKA